MRDEQVLSRMVTDFMTMLSTNRTLDLMTKLQMLSRTCAVTLKDAEAAISEGDKASTEASNLDIQLDNEKNKSEIINLTFDGKLHDSHKKYFFKSIYKALSQKQYQNLDNISVRIKISKKLSTFYHETESWFYPVDKPVDKPGYIDKFLSFFASSNPAPKQLYAKPENLKDIPVLTQEALKEIEEIKEDGRRYIKI